MTITALPINASSGSPAYNARQTRQAFSALMMPGAAQLRTRSGFRPGGAPSVSVTSTTWTVGAFSCVVDAGVSAVQGPYLVSSDANATGSVTAADSTFDRIDILYVQVSDTDEDGSGQRSATVGYLAGTPAATPTAPATPARSLRIGNISVPHVGAGSPAFTASGTSFVAAGGAVPVFSSAEASALALVAGSVVARMDFSPPRLDIYDGTNLIPGGVRPLSARKTSGDQTLDNNATLTNVTDMAVTLAPNSNYQLACRIRYRANATPSGSDMKFGWTGPTGFSMDYTAFAVPVGSTALAQFNNSATSVLAVGGFNADLGIVMTGLVQTGGSGGTLQLQFAQNTQKSGNGVIVRNGGTIFTLTPIA